MVTIVFSAGPRDGERLELDGEKVVGRAGCDITLDDAEVSRRHAALRPTASGVQVEDLGSSNGTAVDGARISGPVDVGDGGVIRIGSSELVVEVVAVQEAPQGATRLRGAPPPAPALAGAGTSAGGGLPGWFWGVTGLVELAVILTGVGLLVYYAVR